MAMRGKDCVAIAADRRFGIQAQMVTTDFQKIFPMGDRLYIGLAGLATDVQTVWGFFNLCVCHYYSSKIICRNKLELYICTFICKLNLSSLLRSQRLKFRLNLYELKEGRQIKPKTFMSMVSNLLYERRWMHSHCIPHEMTCSAGESQLTAAANRCALPRFGPYYIEPVIAGLDPKTFEPFICSLDLIGCPMVTEDFVVSGTCSEQMYGMCESLWEPNMVSGERVTDWHCDIVSLMVLSDSCPPFVMT